MELSKFVAFAFIQAKCFQGAVCVILYVCVHGVEGPDQFSGNSELCLILYAVISSVVS